ncbi:MAG: DUF2586 family protein [Marinifilaceae bacterium]|jgi:hypothetical protein|nr:DUF2586 family protein [Marinifilaceae bacterium]
MLPNVKIVLGNGNLGQVAPNTDSVAGLILTGSAVSGKLEYNTHYLLASDKDLETLGVDEKSNPLVAKDVKAFYAQAGQGAELHLVVVEESTSFQTMCSTEDDSPINKLISGGMGRIRIVGLNKNPSSDYTADLAKKIDKDAILAGDALQKIAEKYASDVKPFRAIIAASLWNSETTDLYKPSESSNSRVGYVIAADKNISNNYSAAIGMVLGRAAKVEVHQSVGRVKEGALCQDPYFTDGKKLTEHYSDLNLLHDAGYIFFRDYPGLNGAYINADSMAVSMTDDYSSLSLGRVIDKASVVAYSSYIKEIMDNVSVDDKGKLSPGVAKSYEGIIENAIMLAMGSQISSFTAYVDSNQKILSTGKLDVKCRIVPQAILKNIEVDLSFNNPAVSK